MIERLLDVYLIAWFVVAGLSTAYVAWDQFRGNPEPAVMKWGFVLITLYTGPLGLLLYVMADKEPRPGQHEAFVAPLWKQGAGSTIHCVAGDATGIILAAVVTAALGLPMWADLLVEYAAGFSVGLFVFQALFMKNMMGGTWWENVKATFVPEFISMNAMMAGMAPVMALGMMGRDMRAMEPTELAFWAVMSAGVIAGYLVAYPVNVWMVSRGLKHGLMTVRDGAAAGHGKAKKTGRPAAAPAAAPAHAKRASHGMRGTSDLAPAQQPTRAQIATVATFTTLMLLSGLALPWLWVNMRLSARDVGGALMPPGMVMTRDMPAGAMRDMAAVRPRDVAIVAAADARGDQPLAPRLEAGVKVFELETGVVRWHILPDVAVEGYAVNGQIPGPRLRVTEGDRVRIHVRNRLPEPTTLHWHGLVLPNAMDGAAEVTQAPIAPGAEGTYEFTAKQAGTFFYHSHADSDRQQSLGLYGALVIDPKDASAEPRADHDVVVQLQEWLEREGRTFPAMPMEGAMPNYFTINGKAYPSTESVAMRVGETVRLRFIGSQTNGAHPMHVHGGPFTVIARDGVMLAPAARYEADTVNVAPGERYDVIWTAREPGKWLVHCHIPHHTANDGVMTHGGGGLMMILDVAPA